MFLFSTICSLLLVGSSYAAPVDLVYYDAQSSEEKPIDLVPTVITKQTELESESEDESTMRQMEWEPELREASPMRQVELESVTEEASTTMQVELEQATEQEEEEEEPTKRLVELAEEETSTMKQVELQSAVDEASSMKQLELEPASTEGSTMKQLKLEPVSEEDEEEKSTMRQVELEPVSREASTTQQVELELPVEASTMKQVELEPTMKPDPIIREIELDPTLKRGFITKQIESTPSKLYKDFEADITATTISDSTTMSDLTATPDPTSPSNPPTTLDGREFLNQKPNELSIEIPVRHFKEVILPFPKTTYQPKLEVLHYPPLPQAFASMAPYSPMHFPTPVIQADPYTTFELSPRVVFQPVIQMQQAIPFPYTEYVPPLSVQSPYTQIPVFNYNSQVPMWLPQSQTFNQPSSYDLHQIRKPTNLDDEDESTYRRLTNNLWENEEFMAILADVTSKAKGKYHFDQVVGTSNELLTEFSTNKRLQQILSEAYAKVKPSPELIDLKYKSTLRFVRFLVKNYAHAEYLFE